MLFFFVCFLFFILKQGCFQLSSVMKEFTNNLVYLKADTEPTHGVVSFHRTDCKLWRCLVVQPEHHWSGASPDGILDAALIVEVLRSGC